MTLTVQRDPGHGAGGHALLRVENGAALPDEVTVSVFETYSERWLAPSAQDGPAGISVGAPNWQAGRHLFGPYRVQRRDGAAEIAIGPEIVNKIEGYTQVRIVAGPVEGQLFWPNDIQPLDLARQRIGLQVARRTGAAQGPEPALRQAEAGVTAPPPLPPDAPMTEQDSAGIAAPEPRRRRWLWLVLALGLVVLAALLGLGYSRSLQQQWPFSAGVEPPPAPEPQPEPTPEPKQEPTPEPAAATPGQADPCTPEALGALGGITAITRAAGACGQRVGRDQMLIFVETAAQAGDAEALLLFGTLYDAAVTDPTVETQLGLSFADAPAQAADYYSRARAAGSAAAAGRLTAVCARLRAAEDTLSRGALDDFCR